MANTVPALVGPVLFGSTVFIILLHAVEWFQLGTLSRPTAANTPTSRKTWKFMFLKAGLGVETFYYFLLLIALIAFFPGNLLFLILIAILGLFHLTAFQATLSKRAEGLVQKLTMRRITGVLVFDIVEVIILIALAIEFYPLVYA